MRYADIGRIWASRLLQGATDTVAMRLPQPGYKTGNPGNPVADGAGQTGQLLAMRGLVPGYLIQEGQAFSLIVSGQRYDYFAVADVAADGTGRAPVVIRPMIRKSPPDGAVVELGQPVIEGFLVGDPSGWTGRAAKTVGISFTIEERA
jgi:hypothetical protein